MERQSTTGEEIVLVVLVIAFTLVLLAYGCLAAP